MTVGRSRFGPRGSTTRGRLSRSLAIITIAGGSLVALRAGVAVADGIPTPMPGALQGPSGDTLRSIATANGLTCQDDPIAPGTEAFCQNGSAPGGEQDSATFSTNPGLVLVAAVSTNTPPLPDHAESFLVAMSAPFCAGGEAEVRLFYESSVARGFDGGQTSYGTQDASCRLDLVGNDTPQFAFRTITAFSLITAAGPVPSLPGASVPGPTSPIAGPSVAPIATPAPAAGGTQGGPPKAGAIAASVSTPATISLDLANVAQSAILALVVVLLMPFPAQLFNSTLERHYHEVRGWFPKAPVALGTRAFWASPLGVVVFVLISAVLYALLDPRLGLTAESAAEVVGLGLGIVATAFAFRLPSLLAHRAAGDTWHINVLPGTILVGVLCVLVSRVTGFLPGYVYGLILGLSFSRELSREREGKLVALSGLLMLVLAVAAWFVLSAIGSTDQGIVAIALRTVLAALVVGGLEGVAFGLIPLRFLHGEILWAWNRVVWAVVFGLGVFAFAHILVNPQSGYLADSSRTPFLTIVALFVGFAALSIAFWAYFRYRPEPKEPAGAEPPGG